MRKLTWHSAAFFALATCFSSMSYAQHANSVDYYYQGPLDSNPTSSASTQQPPQNVVTAPVAPRVPRPPSHASQASVTVPVAPRYARATRQGPLDGVAQQSTQRIASSMGRGPLDVVSASASASRYARATSQGPLDVVRVPATPRAPRMTPERLLQELHSGANSTAAGTRSNEGVFEVARRNSRSSGPASFQSFAPPTPSRALTNQSRALTTQPRAFNTQPQALTAPTQAPTIPGQVRPLNQAQPTFVEPTTQGRPTFAEPMTQGQQTFGQQTFTEPTTQGQPTFTEPMTETPTSFTGSITQAQSFPARRMNPQSNLMNIPPAQDPTRFGYRDGEAFGFDNTRLYNPLEGPQLELQGAPTADFGPRGCDEWAGFCRNRDISFDCNCGGLKANPGHLGLPWLGGKDNCDQTVRRNRGCGCKECQTQSSCDSCSESNCESCSGR